MLISKEFKGKSLEEAVQTGLLMLNLDRDDVQIEVIERESKGFLGFGRRDAVIKLTYDDGQPDPSILAAAKPAEKKFEAPKAEKKFEAPKPERKPKEKPAKAPKAEKAEAPKVEAPKAEEKPAEAPKAEKPKKIATPEEAAHSEAVAQDFLKGILEIMGVEAEIKGSVDAEENTVHIELEGDNMGFVIGRRGETLDALQYLATIVTNKAEDSRWRVSLDTENYREKRTQALVALANKTANTVTKTGKSIALEPMNPQERRIIHSALQDNKNVTTFSTGQEPRRKIVIAPQGQAANKKPSKPHKGGKRK
ncbi:MAG: Jag N-terminal domain-containing protein [Clostridia bacterium]|nr:Jag N-terminal domain-containing protein [Clostridia bacterium]